MSRKFHMHWFWFGLFVYAAAVGALLLTDVRRPVPYFFDFLVTLVAPAVAVPTGMAIVKIVRRIARQQPEPEKEPLL